MAKFSEAQNIASKFGTATEDIEQAVDNTIEGITMAWMNEGMQLMNTHLQRTSKSRANNLGQSLFLTPVEVAGDTFTFKIAVPPKQAQYADYVDKGVQKSPKLRGGKTNTAVNKAPNSPYKFKNLGTPKAMVDSFKSWSAQAGVIAVKGTKASFKGKTKKKAVSDQERIAKTLAVWTKIGGIKPKNYIEKAASPKRVKQLADTLSKAIGRTITVNLTA
jgi:hypothetical protein